MEKGKNELVPTMREMIDGIGEKQLDKTIDLEKGQSVGVAVMVFDDVSRMFDLKKVSKLVISNEPDAL